MKSLLNLHIHSSCGDGGNTVDEIESALTIKGVTCYAITDHDRVSSSHGISGVELSCCLSGEGGLDHSQVCHILGYNVDETMQAHCKRLLEHKDETLKQLVSRLIKDGYRIDAKADFPQLRHVAKLLVEGGYAQTVFDAFNCILLSDRYIEYAKTFPSVKEGIRLIHSAGGIAIWAHPFETTNFEKTTHSRECVKEILDCFIAYGLDGIEVYYQDYKGREIEFLERLALRHGLKMSIGTDFHGKKEGEKLVFDVAGVVPNEGIESVLLDRAPLTHEMRLYNTGFEQMQRGVKTIEVRLLDEKRSQVRAGDSIRFTNIKTGETLTRVVKALRRYPSFKELLKNCSFSDIGFFMRGRFPSQQEVGFALRTLEDFYPIEQQDRCDALAIYLQLDYEDRIKYLLEQRESIQKTLLEEPDVILDSGKQMYASGKTPSDLRAELCAINWELDEYQKD